MGHEATGMAGERCDGTNNTLLYPWEVAATHASSLGLEYGTAPTAKSEVSEPRAMCMCVADYRHWHTPIRLVPGNPEPEERFLDITLTGANILPYGWSRKYQVDLPVNTGFGVGSTIPLPVLHTDL